MKKLLITSIVLLIIGIGLLSYLIIDSRTETEEVSNNVLETNTNDNSNTNTNTAVPIIEWELFENEKYFYSFQHPSNCKVVTNYTMSHKETASILEVAGAGCRGLALQVQVYNEKNVIPGKEDLVQKNLLDFTNTLYEENLNDENPNLEKTLGEIKETQINCQTAYYFTVRGDFVFPNGSSAIEEERKIYITEKDGNKFIIEQALDSSISSIIVSTFRFTD